MKHAFQTEFSQYMERARRFTALNNARWLFCAWFSAIGIGSFCLSLGLSFNETVDCVLIGGAVSALLLAIRFVIQRVSGRDAAEYLDKCLKNTHLARTCYDLQNKENLSKIEENAFKTANESLSKASLWPERQHNWRICLALGAVTLACSYGIHSLRLGYMPTIELTPSQKNVKVSSGKANAPLTKPKTLRPVEDAIALSKILEESTALDEKTKNKLKQWRQSLNKEGGAKDVDNSLVEKIENLVDISNVMDQQSSEAKALLNQQVNEIIKQAVADSASNTKQTTAEANANSTGQQNNNAAKTNNQTSATASANTGTTSTTKSANNAATSNDQANAYRGQHNLDGYQQAVLKRYFK